jgi:hypothetical protein
MSRHILNKTIRIPMPEFKRVSVVINKFYIREKTHSLNLAATYYMRELVIPYDTKPPWWGHM